MGPPVCLPEETPPAFVSGHGLDEQPRSPAQRRWAKRGALEQGIGASRGGRTTKVHLVTDEQGRPLAYRVTDGRGHDVKTAPVFLETLEPTVLAADKAYDSNALREALTQRDIVAVIPPTANRKHDVPTYNRYLYRQRNGVERCFSWMKHQRRFATRYDKLKRNYAVFVVLSCCLIWLRHPPP